MAKSKISQVRLDFGPLEFASFIEFTKNHDFGKIEKVFNVAASLMLLVTKEHKRGYVIGSIAQDISSYRPMLLVGNDPDSNVKLSWRLFLNTKKI